MTGDIGWEIEDRRRWKGDRMTVAMGRRGFKRRRAVGCEHFYGNVFEEGFPVNFIILKGTMDLQLDFFSAAVDHLQNAYDAIESLDFEQAKEQVAIAREIDPFNSTLNTTAKLIALYEKHHNDCGDVATFLAQMWQFIPQACQRRMLLIAEARLADSYLARIAARHLGQGNSFIDPGEILHWGCCYFISSKYEKARKALLNTLASTHPLRADLWAYYGDVCMKSKRTTEAMSAYLNAVAIDPQTVDMFRIRNEEISELFLTLQKSYPESEARALLLFQGWLDGLFKIPKFFGKFFDEHRAFQTMLDEEIPQDRATRIHHFSVCLCRDQSQADGGTHDYRYRERMMELDEELFGRYMKKLGG